MTAPAELGYGCGRQTRRVVVHGLGVVVRDEDGRPYGRVADRPLERG